MKTKIKREDVTAENVNLFLEQYDIAYGGKELPSDIDTVEARKRIFKINLVTLGDLTSLNGEGVWAYLRHLKDFPNYQHGGEVFEVILLNNPIRYGSVLTWGAIITVEFTSKTTRPILSREWIAKRLNAISDTATVH